MITAKKRRVIGYRFYFNGSVYREVGLPCLMAQRERLDRILGPGVTIKQAVEWLQAYYALAAGCKHYTEMGVATVTTDAEEILFSEN